ncbi:hypothetical protein JYK22_21610, partial [Nonomuraea sp. RK-328]|nr:hypothetical protein [Nonomuraea sp. RK-328]
VIHSEFWARYLGEWAAVAAMPARAGTVRIEPETSRPSQRLFETSGPAVELAEARVLERLAVLTARLGPWEAAARLFGVHGPGGDSPMRASEAPLAAE